MARNGVRNHGERRSGGGDEGEDAPEEEEYAESDRDFFGGGDAEEIGEGKEEEIEEDVFALPDGIEAGGSSLLDQLCEPGIVDVAAEITGFDVGCQKMGMRRRAERRMERSFIAIGESITRVGKEEEV